MLAALVTLGLPALGLPAAAVAAGSGAQSFTTTGEQRFVVPAGVTSVQATLVGGNGGAGYQGSPGFYQTALGGTGATALATIAVTPGEVLFVEVAGDGQSGGGAGAAGGSGGGGAGGYGDDSGGGGGGASDIRTCSIDIADPANPPSCAGSGSAASRLIVAGGGGGGGDEGTSGSALGGEGGSAGGPGAGGTSEGAAAGGGGGHAGTQGQGGSGGGHSYAGPAGSGGLGSAGAGGPGGQTGGGGGGGDYIVVSDEGHPPTYFPQNGGGGGGGGGASGVPTGVTQATGASILQTAPGAEPSITFTWTLPPPAAVTGTPSALTSTSATLLGTVNADGSPVNTCYFSVMPRPPSGAPYPCQQQVGSGSTPVAVSASLAGLMPATTYTATLVASSDQGTGMGATVTFTTPPASSTSASAGTDRSGPTVSNLKLSPTRFHRGKHAAKLATHSRRRKPAVATATTISFQLSAAATVTLGFKRAQPGQLSGHSCLAPSAKRPLTKRHPPRRCTRYTPVSGTITLAGHAGSNRISFEGILDGAHKLPPGSYQLALTAGNEAGSTTAAQHPTFVLLG